MSSDNFYLVRRAGDRYAVSMEFASSTPDPDELLPLALAVARFYYPTPIDSPNLAWFDSLSEALDYAHAEYSEYGVETDTTTDASDDTRAARIASLFRAIDPSEEGIMQTNDHEGGTATLHWGSFQIRVAGNSFAEASALAGWLDAIITVSEDEPALAL